jgi:hypothetical protein
MVEYRKHNVRSEEDLETLSSGEGRSHYEKSDYAFVSKRDPIADYIC